MFDFIERNGFVSVYHADDVEGEIETYDPEWLESLYDAWVCFPKEMFDAFQKIYFVKAPYVKYRWFKENLMQFYEPIVVFDDYRRDTLLFTDNIRPNSDFKCASFISVGLDTESSTI